MVAAERRLAVLGAGTMGHGIAQVAAMAGHRVALVDTKLDLAQRAVERIHENLTAGVERGKLTAADRAATLGRVTASADLPSAAAAADVVIEAVPERMDLKVAVLQMVEHAARPDALLATNTSSLSVSEIQRSLSHPERMLGLHFFNPAHINRLVEVVRGDHTSEQTLHTALELVREIGKEPVVVRDSPGFATSRLGVLLGLEAMRMLESGVASAEAIDRAMELGYRHPMGPLRLSDLVGLDVRLDIARYLHEKLGTEQFRPPRILEEMVAQGKLGKKSGVGFYSWTED
jgi:3-hydroxybutyryl-CoA dehydrogenase